MANSSETGTKTFYGGFERWQARIGNADVFLGVIWPIKTRPEEGASILYLVKPLAPDRRADR